MSEVGIPNNARCLIHRQPVLDNGDIGLIVYTGKSTLKEIYIDDKGVVLKWSDGSEYEKHIKESNITSLA